MFDTAAEAAAAYLQFIGALEIKNERNRRSRLPAEDRFWFSVNKTESCWHWTGTTSPRGYGKLKHNKQDWRAHRFSWVMHFGAIPKGLNVLHRCDNPSCVNPSHLFLGTHSDNHKDKVSKNRQAKGSRSGQSKLTEQIVLQMRHRHSLGRTYAELGREFGVSNVAARLAVIGRTWTHVKGSNCDTQH
jgi:hypothetical protein